MTPIGELHVRPSSADHPMPSLAEISRVFVRYGNFTLGGGSATTAVIYGEIVDRRRWVDDGKFALSFALGRLTPGTNLLAFCTGIGWLLRGMPGALAALLAASIPCAVIAVAVTALFARVEESAVAQAALQGAVAAAVGITIKTCWTIAGPYFRGTTRLQVAAIAGAAFVVHVAGLPAIEILLLAAAVGAVLPPVRQ